MKKLFALLLLLLPFVVSANPILPGFHADPEILYSNKDGKYYIYSTTDGVPHWGGTTYHAFSAPSIHGPWTDCGVVLDAASSQIPWADGNLWAPAAIERLENDVYKYYLYFSANNPASKRKEIGVAVASDPAGPFTVVGHPIITDDPSRRGQQIDVDVFRDPVSGKYYLYWGNSFMAGAELSDDLLSIKPETITIMTPQGGTLESYSYREAPYVFYRDGRYYFMWSVDDTGSPNYHVAYGTSDSPLGKIKVAEPCNILVQRPGQKIYGTAHNSVINVPGTDEWWIVYHRINPVYLDKKMGPGYHREVCADRMYFNSDGSIKEVIPTGAPDVSTVSSPDGQLTATVEVKDGVPSYSLTYKDKPYILSSPLGLETHHGNFTKGLHLVGVSPVEEVRDSYSLPNIKKSHVDYDGRRRVFSFAPEGDTTAVFAVEFQLSDNNAGLRYHLRPVKGRHGSVVYSESTAFTLPEGTTTFICHQSKGSTGWANTYPSYETQYAPDATMGENGKDGEGYTFPALFHTPDGWALISETGVDGSYCASRLLGGEGATYKVGYPMASELRGEANTHACVALPSSTPWRTITVGESLAPIMETTVPFDLVRPKYEAKHTHDYGKGTWSWIIGMDPSMNYDEQKRYIDFTHDLGYETVLVDALWDGAFGRKGVEELAAYAKSKGVDLYLWYNSNGWWNDAYQGPRNIMNNSRLRRQEMEWMKKNGIRGIKVDFFGGDSQAMMQLYEDILSDANDYGILVIFHGCTLPRGWERMFPAYAASEAVLASENMSFSQSFDDNEAYNACLHPFIRNAVGSMDFGGSALNRWYNAGNTPNKGSQRRTSDVFAIATAVMFQSPVQHFALAPNNLTDAPAWAIDFMKTVPTEWDDVRFIDGYPGKYVVMARRSGDKWYVVGVNAQKEPIKLKLDLPMIPAGSEATLYTDDKDLNGSVKTIRTKKGLFPVTIPTDGAFVLTIGK